MQPALLIRILPWPLKLQLADAVLGVGLRLGRTEVVAAGLALTALVTAEENVMFEIAHVCIHLVVIGFDCYQY